MATVTTDIESTVAELMATPDISNRERARRAGIAESTFRGIAARLRKDAPMSNGHAVEVDGLTIDPEFRDLIPPLAEEEYAQLLSNIKADGCRDAIVVWDGTIIDGHNRYDICTENGLPYRTHSVTFPDRDAAKAWIIRNQFGRRNLTAYQRAELALHLKPMLAAEAETRDDARRETGPESRKTRVGEDGRTRAKLAKVAGIGDGTMYKAEVIAARASEPVKEALRRGDMRIAAAYREVVGEAPGEPEDDPDAWLDSIPVRSRLSDRCRAIFDRAAKRHRQAESIRKSILSAGLAKEPEIGEVLDPFTREMIRVARFPFPHAWLECLGCDGGKNTTRCPQCNDCGFIIPGPGGN